MFHLQNITKTYNEKLILDKATLAVNSDEVIALIGENGVGKTTLLKILLGEVTPDEGTVSLHNEVVGYVPQEPINQEKTVEDSFGSIESWRIDYALSMVNLNETNAQNVKSLSGGQKTRLAIAQVLAKDPEPSVLLLDEPTNNIDSEGLKWLRQFISNFSGAILLASHDRDFINKSANVVIELKNGELKRYGGNYDFYTEQRALERAAEEKAYDAHIEEKKRLEATIRLQRENGRHTHEHIQRKDGDKYQRDFFRNRVTVKLGQQAKNLETRLDKLEEVERPESSKRYKVTLSSATSHDKKLVTTSNLSKHYDNKLALNNVSLEIRGGDRLHIQGINGSGKSTLLKLIAGMIKPDSGHFEYGRDVSIGYFSQEIDGLNYEVSALENATVGNASATSIYKNAMSMGLNERDLKKLPTDLSRGQQAKLAFTRLLLSKNDLLILDEPTNHLDIATKEKLEEALREYKGSLLVASHDAYFVKRLKINKRLVLTDGKDTA